MTVLTDATVDRHFELVGDALQKVSIASTLSKDKKEMAQALLDKAQRHFDDAASFRERGKVVEAFASINYVEGVLDAGACFGFFKRDSIELFCK
jgi:hypothetical protein